MPPKKRASFKRSPSKKRAPKVKRALKRTTKSSSATKSKKKIKSKSLGRSLTKNLSPKSTKKIAAKKRASALPLQAEPKRAEFKFENLVAELSRSTPSGMEASKFDIGVSNNAQSISSKELPSEYGKNLATILVVDPKLVFTYWEVRPDAMLGASTKLGKETRLTLRFYDITETRDTQNSPSWDVEVFDRVGNWYLRLEYPEQVLALDIGMKGASGHFHTIVRSNLVRLPKPTLARPGPIKWMIVTPQGETLPSDSEEYTDADMTLLKKILGPYFFDLLMRGRFASIGGSSLEAIFSDLQSLRIGESPSRKTPWNP